MKPDPIVAEIRKTREAISRRYGNDPDKIYQAMKRAEAKDAWPRAKLAMVTPRCEHVAETPVPYAAKAGGRNK